jgi:hypothetical protein
MYRLKFYTTTKYPTGNEELDKDILRNLPTEATLCDVELNKYIKAGKTNRVTSVCLYQGSTIQPEALVASATVRRYFKDLDIPALGKKLAVEKLINENNFSRPQRKEIWKALWRHSPKVEALRRGAYKEEILKIKQADRWRNWEEEIGLNIK